MQLQAAAGFRAFSFASAAEGGGGPSRNIEDILGTLFPSDDIRLYEPRKVKDGCARNEEKVIAMLRSLGREEVEAVIAEQGEIVVNDEICNQGYRFGPAEVSAILG